MDTVPLNVAVRSLSNDSFSRDKEVIPRHGSVDGNSLNLAVQPHGNVTMFNGMSRSLANGSLKAVPVSNGNLAAHTHETTLEPALFIPMDGMLADNTVSLVANMRVEAPSSPPLTNGNQEAEATMLPPVQNDNQNTMATASFAGQDPVGTGPVAGEIPVANDVLLPATRLKLRLENTSDLIVCPGVYDGFSARIALSIGFDALYMGLTHS